VFLDESGFMLTPTVRRTLAPRGRTPILRSWDRHDRISAISAVTISPVRRNLGLYFRLLPDDTNAHAEDIVSFLSQLRDQIRGPMTILWDRSKIHGRSRLVRAYLAKHPEIHTEELPAYAPETNPQRECLAAHQARPAGELRPRRHAGVAAGAHRGIRAPARTAGSVGGVRQACQSPG